MSEPRLIVAEPPAPARAVAVVLHGGRSKSQGAVRGTQAAVLRMQPFVASLRKHGGPSGLVVAQVRYRVRGWNGAARSPVADTEWALDQLVARFPGVPVALVGHSMGGRTALYTAGHDAVRSVVGLAPWIEPGDPVEPVAGRRLLIAHGDRDRMTDPRASAAYVSRAERVAASVSFVRVTGERHAMLRRASLWHRLSTGFVLGTLLGQTPTDAQDAEPSDVLTRALAGQGPLVV
jgi:dienelactone hydrolase